jgi:cell wall-associated NlpC family hydrolase
VATSLLLPLLATPAAQADQISDLQGQASALEAQINANGMKLDALNEKVNDAQVALDAANAAIADADAQVAAATARMKSLRNEVAARAATAYVQSSSTSGVDNLDTTSASELSTREKYTSIAGQRDKLIVAQLAQAKEDLAQKKADAETARASAQAEKDQIVAAQTDLQAGTVKQRDLLSQVNGQISDLVAKAQAEREARDQAAAAAQLKLTAANTNAGAGGGGGGTIGGRSSGGGGTFATPPPTSGNVGAVLAYAAAQLGKPYCYAGAGPSCFDCSGLSMMAWAQAGVSMPHGSDAQLAMFPHVPLSQLQPGDLVFWDGHVGIYWGGGAVLHAPHTGTVVQITPIWPGVIGAVRP